MKKLFMFAAFFLGGLMFTGCSDDDSSNNNGSGDNRPDADGYVIEVEPGLTMPENKFTNRLSYPGDPDIVATLQKIDKVTDIKPFMMITYDPNTEKFVQKIAYYFNYKQDIDHNNPSKGWFKQQCILTVAGKDRPTVLHTEGYTISNNDKNDMDNYAEPSLTRVLNANCLTVEYRYYGWSLPEGYTNRFNYLTTKQQTDDLHAIVEAIKKSGIVGNGKWISTGVSKNGQTTACYAVEYPNDADAFVPFCSPFMLSLDEKGVGNYMLSTEALNKTTLDKVKAAMVEYCSNKTLQGEVEKLYIAEAQKENVTVTQKDAHMNTLYYLFHFYFKKMSYVNYRKWEKMIPEKGDNALKFYTFIMADDNYKYELDTETDWQRRQNDDDMTSDDFEWYYDSTTRANDETKVRKDPFDIQTYKEIGTFIYVIPNEVENFLTKEEKDHIINFENSSEFSNSYMQKILNGLKASTRPIYFVYGMQDPWTGNRIPDSYLGSNSKIQYIKEGTHNDYIENWTDDERNQFFTWLKSQGFEPVSK